MGGGCVVGNETGRVVLGQTGEAFVYFLRFLFFLLSLIRSVLSNSAVQQIEGPLTGR